MKFQSSYKEAQGPPCYEIEYFEDGDSKNSAISSASAMSGHFPDTISQTHPRNVHTFQTRTARLIQEIRRTFTINFKYRDSSQQAADESMSAA
jgi:hypothetical protein